MTIINYKRIKKKLVGIVCYKENSQKIEKILQHNYKNKKAEIQTSSKQQTKCNQKPELPANKRKKEKQPIKHKPDVFQRVFNSIMGFVRELRLESNADRHTPI